jgi:hypothetical protein
MDDLLAAIMSAHGLLDGTYRCLSTLLTKRPTPTGIAAL